MSPNCGCGTPVPASQPRRCRDCSSVFTELKMRRGRTHEGSGIGLALVQDLVKLHGGTVTAESKLGHGTIFVVSLPLGANHLPTDQVGGKPTR